MASAQLRGLVGDHFRDRCRRQLACMEKDSAILIGKLLVTAAHWMYKHLGQGQYGSYDSKLTAINSFKERPNEWKEDRILFNQVDEGSCVQTDDRAAQRLYPFHEARS